MKNHNTPASTALSDTVVRPVSLYAIEEAREEDRRGAWELVALSLCGISMALAILLPL